MPMTLKELEEFGAALVHAYGFTPAIEYELMRETGTVTLALSEARAAEEVARKLREVFLLAEAMLMLQEMAAPTDARVLFSLSADGTDWPFSITHGGVQGRSRKSLVGAIREAHAKWKSPPCNCPPGWHDHCSSRHDDPSRFCAEDE